MSVGPRLHPLLKQIGIYEEFCKRSLQMDEISIYNRKRENLYPLDYTGLNPL
jgi:hypothetical protein